MAKLPPEFITNKADFWFALPKDFQNAAIFIHRDPDPDCLCSALALRRILKGHNPENPPKVYIIGKPHGMKHVWINGRHLVTPEFDSSIRFDACFFMDTPKLKTVSCRKVAQSIASTCQRVFVIDHHKGTPEGFEELECNRVYFVNWPERSSTCEIVFELAPQGCVTPVVAQLLYDGIQCDTHNLKSSNFRTFYTLGAIAELQPLTIFDNVSRFIDGIQYEYARFEAFILYNHAKITPEGLLVFEVTYGDLVHHFPRFHNRRQLAGESYLIYLFNRFSNIKIGQERKPLRGILGIYPNKFDPKGSGRFIIYQHPTPLTDFQLEQVKDLGFQILRENQRALMKGVTGDKELADIFSTLLKL